MKDIVIHVREDVCAKYQRDPEATKLIEIAKEFGSVETLDSAIAAEREKHQTVVKNLEAQYAGTIKSFEAQIEAIKEQKVTPEEIEILRAVRKKTAIEAAQYEEAIKLRDDNLKTVVAENENRVAQLRTLFKL